MTRQFYPEKIVVDTHLPVAAVLDMLEPMNTPDVPVPPLAMASASLPSAAQAPAFAPAPTTVAIAVTTAAVLGLPLMEVSAGLIPRPRKLAVLAALANPTRFRMVRELTDGRPRTITQLARVVRRDPDLISKHLDRLRAAGVLARQQGVDRRCQYFYLPGSFLTVPGRIDFGCVSVAVD